MRVLLALAASLTVLVGGAGAASADPLPPSAPVDGQEIIVDQDPDSMSTRSAAGCTLSNAGAGSSNCVYVNGEGDRVNYIQAYMEMGASGFPPILNPNICERAYEFQYYRRGFTVPQTVVLNQPGCDVALPARQFRMTHYVNSRLTDGSTVCTRTKSNLSFDTWSPYACVYINA